MSQEKGIVHIFLIILIFALLAAGFLYFIFTRTQLSKYTPEAIRPLITVTLTTPKAVYSNPLDKSTQYTNPFDEKKNPFDTIK